MKFFQYVGVGAACVFVFSSCVGSGSQQPLSQGKLTNPMDVGFMVGYEVPKISDRWSRVFGFYRWFDVGNPQGQPQQSDYSATPQSPAAQPGQPGVALMPSLGSRSWVPWDRCGVFSNRAGDNDVNCDGRVDQLDFDLIRRANEAMGNPSTDPNAMPPAGAGIPGGSGQP